MLEHYFCLVEFKLAFEFNCFDLFCFGNQFFFLILVFLLSAQLNSSVHPLPSAQSSSVGQLLNSRAAQLQAAHQRPIAAHSAPSFLRRCQVGPRRHLLPLDRTRA
jgi:hypothetical protein